MIKVVWADASSQQPTVRGQFAGASLSLGAGRATLDDRDARELRAILGHGYLVQPFHLHLDDGTLLENCRIVESGGVPLRGGVEIHFAGTSTL